MIWGAGNSSSNYSGTDRDSDDVLVISATDLNDNLASFSSYGTYIDLAAPGVNIQTSDSGSDQDYAIASGTSYSCPMTAGVCAMIWSQRPELSPDDVEAILKASCMDIGAPGLDEQFGHGRIDLLAALELDGSAMPTAKFGAPFHSGRSPLTVDFRNQSSGVPTTFAWDFGDGNTSIERNPSHIYTTTGFYTVTLIAGNIYGSTTAVRTDLIAVDLIPPVAEFSATPTSGNSPVLIQFTDESTAGTATAWSWSFGNGRTSNLQNPAHLYTAAGTYSVTLTSSNPYGSDPRTRTNYITVGPGPPILAQFSATPTTGTAPLQVTFTDESLGAVTGWTWEFDDGTTSNEANPVHTFTSPGEYNIVFQVSNALGDDHSIELEAFIVVQ